MFRIFQTDQFPWINWKKNDKTALLWLLQTPQVFVRLLNDYWRLLWFTVVLSSKGQASYEMEIVMAAENPLLRWRPLQGYGDHGRWLAWPALHMLPKFCLIPGKGGSFNFWEDKCACRSEWQSSVWHLDPWWICLFFVTWVSILIWLMYLAKHSD